MMRDKSLLVIIIVLLFVSLTSVVFGAVPVTQSVSVLPLKPVDNNDLQGFCNVTDGDGGNVSYEYRWYQNNALFSSSSDSIINSFSGNSFENITFTGNLSVNRTIFLNSDNVLFKAFNITLKGINVSDVLTMTASLNGSSYSPSLFFRFPQLFYDNSWTSKSSQNSGDPNPGEMTIVYTKPMGVAGAVWEVADQLSHVNISIPAVCFNANISKLNLLTKIDRVGTSNTGNTQWLCNNGTTNIVLRDNAPFKDLGGGYQAYDEQIWWIYYPINLSIYLNNTLIYNGSGSFINSTSKVISLNKTHLQSLSFALKNISINFSVAQSSILEYSNVNASFINNYFLEAVSSNINDLSASSTSFDSNYSFSCRGYDGSSYSSWVNSSVVNVTNRLNFSFFNSDSGSSLLGHSIGLSFIGVESKNLSTNNSNVYLESLSPDVYSLFFNANGFEQGSYVLGVDTNTSLNVSLYLQNNSASLVLLTVKDKFGNELQNVKVTVQKWVNNAWVTDQILLTDFQGRAEAYYVLSTVFYNHVLETSDGVVRLGVINDDTNKKLIFAEDVSNGINFNIDILSGSLYESFYNSTFNVNYNLSYVNTTNTSGHFRFFWSDPNGVQRTGCLKVVKWGNNSVVCNNCSTGATNTLFCFVNESSGAFVRYTGSGLIDGWGVSSVSRIIGQSVKGVSWGVTGYVVGFFLVLISFFAFLSSPTIGLMVGTGVFVLLGFLKVIFPNVSLTAFIGLLAISFLIARIKSDGGING